SCFLTPDPPPPPCAPTAGRTGGLTPPCRRHAPTTRDRPASPPPCVPTGPPTARTSLALEPPTATRRRGPPADARPPADSRRAPPQTVLVAHLSREQLLDADGHHPQHVLLLRRKLVPDDTKQWRLAAHHLVERR